MNTEKLAFYKHSFLGRCRFFLAVCLNNNQLFKRCKLIAIIMILVCFQTEENKYTSLIPRIFIHDVNIAYSHSICCIISWLIRFGFKNHYLHFDHFKYERDSLPNSVEMLLVWLGFILLISLVQKKRFEYILYSKL